MSECFKCHRKEDVRPHGSKEAVCFSCATIAELEDGRDNFSSHLIKMQATNGSLTDEIDRLKAELKNITKGICSAHQSPCPSCVGVWKAKAEKLARALRKIYGCDPEGIYAGPTAKEALAEYEKESK